MHRFKITELGREAFWLRGEERNHLVKVLRLSVGDEIVGFDNTGTQYLAVISKIEDKSVTCSILNAETPDVEANTPVYLVCGLSKGEKFEWVIQKGTELGMRGFVPLRARRSVVRIEKDKAQERVSRWQKIAAEAAKQCHRVVEPEVTEVCDWDNLIRILPESTQWLIPYEAEKGNRLSEVLRELNPKEPVALLIGPEGGFEESEVALAKDKLNARSITLGPRILRAETAALASLTMVLAYWGDLG